MSAAYISELTTPPRADNRLVNIQSVIADTKRSIADLQRQIDALICADSDRSTLRRDVGERSLRVRWIRDRVAEVERTTEEGELLERE